MKKLLAGILGLLMIGSVAYAETCTYTAQEVGLVRRHQIQLIQEGKANLVADYYNNFAAEDIPLHLKRQTFNDIAKGRDFELLEGSFIYDYTVVVKFKTCTND